MLYKINIVFRLCENKSSHWMTLFLHKILTESSFCIFFWDKIQPEPIIDNVKKETVHNCMLESTFGSLKNNVLFLIVNQLLTCKDILLLQKTCKFFRKSLLQPNQENMVTFYNHGSQEKINTAIMWEDVILHFFLTSFSLKIFVWNKVKKRVEQL